MTTVFGTLGFTPTKLLPSVAAHADVTHLVFYHDQHARSHAAAEKVRAFCHERDLEVTSRELDAFDIIDCAREMRRDLRRHRNDDVVFNVTGGTPVISAAATLASILEGVRAVYVDERTGREVALPLLTVRYSEILNPHQRRVLRFIADAAPEGCTQADVVRALGLSRATVSHHVKNLKDKQLVVAEAHPKDARTETLRVLESAALLLMDEDDGDAP